MTLPKPTIDSPTFLQFDDNRLLPLLFGQHDQNLARVERLLGVAIASRGNRLAISGERSAVQNAVDALQSLYRRLQRDLPVGDAEVDAACRMAVSPETAGGSETAATPEGPSIKTRKRVVSARSPGQAVFIEALRTHELTFGIGPAGTGKTYIAVAVAVEALLSGQVERIVLSRPAVEAGERLGFLPGDLREKVDPYLRPLYDALYEMMPADRVDRGFSQGIIEVAPLAFMRGRTLNHAVAILDEAQNTTAMQMKMFLTRLGEGSRMIVTGDPSQIDLPAGVPSGLREATRILKNVDGIAQIRFRSEDVVRHELVARIVAAYDADNANEGP